MQKGYRVQYEPRGCWTTTLSAFVALFFVQSISCTAVEAVKSTNRQLSTSNSNLAGDPPLPILGTGIMDTTSHDTLDQPSCSEDPNAIFYFSSFISDSQQVYRDCKWLGNTRNQELTCQYYTESNGDIGPAREVCKVTCNTCSLTHPSVEPTLTPTTSSNYPSLEPIKVLKSTVVQHFSMPTNLPSLTTTLKHNICDEDSKAIFFFRTKVINKEDKHVFHTCEWLSQQSLPDLVCEFLSDSWEGEQMNTHRGETSITTRYGPAKEVCPNTCQSCLHDSDGAPPFASILNESLQHTSLPTRAPTSIPSVPSVEHTQYPSNDYSSLPSHTVQAMVYQYLEISFDGSTFMDPVTLYSAKVVEMFELVLREEIEATLESLNDEDFIVEVYFLTEEIAGEGKEHRTLWSNSETKNSQVYRNQYATFRSLQVENRQVIQLELHIEVRSGVIYSQSSISEQILSSFDTVRGRTNFIEELQLLDSTGIFSGVENIEVSFVISGEEENIQTPYPWIKAVALSCFGITILILVGYVMFRDNMKKGDDTKPDIEYEDQDDVSAYELEQDIPSPTKPFNRILQTQNILPTGDFSIPENSITSASDDLAAEETAHLESDSISVSDTTALPKDGEESNEGNISPLGICFFNEHEHINDAEDETWTLPQPFERITRTSIVIPNGDYQLSPVDASPGKRQLQE